MAGVDLGNAWGPDVWEAGVWATGVWAGGTGAAVIYPNHHLRKTDGTLTEITDTEVTANATKITVADASGISSGDMVEVRRSSADDPPLEIVNPTLLETYGRSTVALTGQAGEGRNYAHNPFFFTTLAFAGAPTICQVALVDSYNGAGPDVTIKDFEGHTTSIEDGSTILIVGSANRATTVDGAHTWVSGTLNIALDDDVGGTVSTDHPVFIWPPVSIDGWLAQHDSTTDPSGQRSVSARASLSAGATQTADVDTTITLDEADNTTVTETLWLTLKNFTGQILQAGDVIENDSTSDRVTVVGRAEVDSAADIGVPVAPLDASGQTWTADDAVTITRPNWSRGDYEGDRLALWEDRADIAAHGWVSEAVRVPFVDGWVLRVHARFAAYNASASNVTITPGASQVGLAVYLLDGSLTEQASQEDAERTYTSDTLEVVDLSADHTPSSEDTYRVRIQAPVQTGRPHFRLTVVPLEVSLSYGPSVYTLTHTEFSGTNKVYAKMAERLRALRHGRQIQAQIRDVAYEAGADVSREKVVLGAPWYLTSDRLGLEAYPDDIEGAIARVHRYRQNLADPTRANVVLDTDLFYLTRDA